MGVMNMEEGGRQLRIVVAYIGNKIVVKSIVDHSAGKGRETRIPKTKWPSAARLNEVFAMHRWAYANDPDPIRKE